MLRVCLVNFDFFILLCKHIIMGEKIVKRDVCVCTFFIYVIEL
jgi:hypothetical protein